MAQNHADQGLIALISTFRAAWGTKRPELDDDQFTAYVASEIDACEVVIRATPAHTIAGALAKAEFYAWYAEASDAYEPSEWGLESAVRDLRNIAAA